MKILSIAMILAAGGIGVAAAAPRYAIEAHQVAAALSNDESRYDSSQVKMLANVSATEESPELVIQSAMPGSGVEAGGPVSFVTVKCRKVGVCMPFIVMVDGVVTASALSTAAKNLPDAQRKAKLPVVMRAGTHATLLIRSERSEIRINVVSLQSGADGSVIHAASPDRKEVYVGKVVGPYLLQGSY